VGAVGVGDLGVFDDDVGGFLVRVFVEDEDGGFVAADEGEDGVFVFLIQIAGVGVGEAVEEFDAVNCVSIINMVHYLFLLGTAFMDDFLKEFSYFFDGKRRSVDCEDGLIEFKKVEEEGTDEVVAFIDFDSLIIFVEVVG